MERLGSGEIADRRLLTPLQATSRPPDLLAMLFVAGTQQRPPGAPTGSAFARPRPRAHRQQAAAAAAVHTPGDAPRAAVNGQQAGGVNPFLKARTPVPPLMTASSRSGPRGPQSYSAMASRSNSSRGASSRTLSVFEKFCSLEERLRQLQLEHREMFRTIDAHAGDQILKVRELRSELISNTSCKTLAFADEIKKAAESIVEVRTRTGEFASPTGVGDFTPGAGAAGAAEEQKRARLGRLEQRAAVRSDTSAAEREAAVLTSDGAGEGGRRKRPRSSRRLSHALSFSKDGEAADAASAKPKERAVPPEERKRVAIKCTAAGKAAKERGENQVAARRAAGEIEVARLKKEGFDVELDSVERGWIWRESNGLSQKGGGRKKARSARPEFLAELYVEARDRAQGPDAMKLGELRAKVMAAELQGAYADLPRRKTRRDWLRERFGEPAIDASLRGTEAGSVLVFMTDGGTSLLHSHVPPPLTRTSSTHSSLLRSNSAHTRAHTHTHTHTHTTQASSWTC